MGNNISLKKMNIGSFYQYLCQNFNYGLVINGKPAEFTDENEQEYRTLSTSAFEKHKTGTCWDFAEYEYLYIKKYYPELNPQLWYIECRDPDGDFPTHSWTSCNAPINGVMAIEVSWYDKRGIHRFKDATEMIETYSKWHRSQYKCPKAKFIVMNYEPVSLDVSGIPFLSYMKYVLSHGTKVAGDGNLTDKWY